MARLGDIGKVVTGNTPKTFDPQNYSSNDICFVKPSDIVEGGVTYLNDSEFYISEYARAKARILAPKSVLVTCIGIIGKVAINDVECAFNQQINAIIPDESKCQTEYLAYAIQNKQVEMQDIANAPVVPILNKTQFSDIEINLPSLTEQAEIVDKLNAVSRLIALRKEQLSKLDELVKARFVELFGNKGYSENTLLNLCNIIDYRGKTPEKVESGLPFITAKNVKMHQMNLEPREYISKETYDKVMVRGFPKEGDVVFTTEAPLGNVCRIPHFDTEFYIGQRIVTLQTEKLEPIYLEYALSSDDFKTKYMGKSSGSTVTGIRVRLLGQLTIPVPPKELQEQFADFVKQIDKSKLAIQQSLEKLETLKKALMQQYFG